MIKDDEDEKKPTSHKKKKSKKKLVDDAVEAAAEGGEEEPLKPKKKKSMKKKKSQKGGMDDDEDKEALKAEITKAIMAADEEQDISSEDVDNANGEEQPSSTAVSTSAKGRSSAYSRRKSSMLAVSDDPFALREGKTLLWRNVNMVLVSVITTLFCHY